MGREHLVYNVLPTSLALLAVTAWNFAIGFFFFSQHFNAKHNQLQIRWQQANNIYLRLFTVLAPNPGSWWLDTFLSPYYTLQTIQLLMNCNDVFLLPDH